VLKLTRKLLRCHIPRRFSQDNLLNGKTAYRLKLSERHDIEIAVDEDDSRPDDGRIRVDYTEQLPKIYSAFSAISSLASRN
jgi:hypothetical protein